MLIVDATHWIEADGSLPQGRASFRSEALRVARLIEYGGPLEVHETRETLVECATAKRSGATCPGLLWVEKTEDECIYAFCVRCATGDTMIANWETTPWAKGQRGPHSVSTEDECGRGGADRGEPH